MKVALNKFIRFKDTDEVAWIYRDNKALSSSGKLIDLEEESSDFEVISLTALEESIFLARAINGTELSYALMVLISVKHDDEFEIHELLPHGDVILLKIIYGGYWGNSDSYTHFINPEHLNEVKLIDGKLVTENQRNGL